MGFIYFLLLIGPLIIVHELGHLLVAKYFGILCPRFSIGMGPVVASFRKGETEYVISAFPIGGYVHIYNAHEDYYEDEENSTKSEGKDEQNVTKSSLEKDEESSIKSVGKDEQIAFYKGRSITDKPIWQRILVYLAGPAMNLLIPIPIFVLTLFFTLDSRLPAVVGMVELESPAAAAGLIAGDEIIEVNGKNVRDFDQLRKRIMRSDGETVQLTVVNGGEEREVSLTPEMISTRDPYLGLRTIEVPRIGIYQMEYGAVIHVDQNTEAYAAGLRSFDHIVSVDGIELDSWTSLVDAFDGNAHNVVLLRPNQLDESFGAIFIKDPLELSLPALTSEELGIQSAIRSVMAVQPGSPAYTAGIEPGDRLNTLDGRAYTALSQFVDRMSMSADEAHSLVVLREGTPITLEITPVTMEVVAEFQTEREETFIGLSGRSVYETPETRPIGFFDRLISSITTAFSIVGQLILAIILGVKALIVGEVGSNSLGGPIMIGDMAARAGRAGFQSFMRMMGLLSINLGILNLVPFPGLDGGSIVLNLVEGIYGKQPSFRTRQIINYVSFAGLVFLMIFIFKNDIERYWPTFANWLNS